IFEINKGSNRNPDIDVNAKMAQEDRRIPIYNMIYVADGPSDVPVFSVVRKGGGKCFAVYDPESQKEFEQNDRLLQDNRVSAYGPADYRAHSQTSRWLKLAVRRICDRIVEDEELALARSVRQPPRHLHREDEAEPLPPVEQDELFTEGAGQKPDTHS
ncbi:MAG: haloacid dehalogenase-like hydrolase, partial [Opitutales bacterium]